MAILAICLIAVLVPFALFIQPRRQRASVDVARPGRRLFRFRKPSFSFPRISIKQVSKVSLWVLGLAIVVAGVVFSGAIYAWLQQEYQREQARSRERERQRAVVADAVFNAPLPEAVQERSVGQTNPEPRSTLNESVLGARLSRQEVELPPAPKWTDWFYEVESVQVDSPILLSDPSGTNYRVLPSDTPIPVEFAKGKVRFSKSTDMPGDERHLGTITHVTINRSVSPTRITSSTVPHDSPETSRVDAWRLLKTETFEAPRGGWPTAWKLLPDGGTIKAAGNIRYLTEQSPNNYLTAKGNSEFDVPPGKIAFLAGDRFIYEKADPIYVTITRPKGRELPIEDQHPPYIEIVEAPEGEYGDWTEGLAEGATIKPDGPVWMKYHKSSQVVTAEAGIRLVLPIGGGVAFRSRNGTPGFESAEGRKVTVTINRGAPLPTGIGAANRAPSEDQHSAQVSTSNIKPITFEMERDGDFGAPLQCLSDNCTLRGDGPFLYAIEGDEPLRAEANVDYSIPKGKVVRVLDARGRLPNGSAERPYVVTFRP